MRDSSKEKQTIIGRDAFRRQQDIEREIHREELQAKGGSKAIKVIKWAMMSILFYLSFLGLLQIQDIGTCPIDYL
jgi:hypothetical protein